MIHPLIWKWFRRTQKGKDKITFYTFLEGYSRVSNKTSVTRDLYSGGLGSLTWGRSLVRVRWYWLGSRHRSFRPRTHSYTSINLFMACEIRLTNNSVALLLNCSAEHNLCDIILNGRVGSLRHLSSSLLIVSYHRYRKKIVTTKLFCQ